MPLYAHADIELTDLKIRRGDEVDPASLDEGTLAAFEEHGTLREEPYDPSEDKLPPADEVEIDGVRYVKASDGMEAGDARS